ncbi:GntR family transcriptional regulator [Rhizobium lusitanum]|uniref:GntR family transcriptional regulator n=1 Tax=Rhizobium lusitanum TaxID=293958 RepID=UPI001956E8C5|nr:GntR family transcriptional regulator [Rhizobium lusitanum]MBM7045573.1 GntR family transcriptional regulator [Rhizobium lusitanum]
MHGISEQVLPLRRETLEDGVYRQLCDLILRGGIVPGESITVASLAEAFGVSPMPVRNALTRLSTAGALTVLSGRTIGIPKLTRERLDELLRVRLTLEPTTAAWAAERAGPRDVGGLNRSFQALFEGQEAGDTKLYLQSNYDFHFEVYRLAQSPIMLSIIESLWLQISPYFHLLRASGNFRISNRHHEDIFHAIENNKPDKARQAMHDDISDAYEVLTGYL